MQKLDTPGAISAADISSAPSADGAIFYSYQQKTSGPPIQAVRRWKDGTSAAVALPRAVTGRGQLSVEGSALVLTAWDEAASPKTAWRIEVPDYVPFATAPGGGGPVAAEDAEPIAPFGDVAWPNYGAPYADESLIKDGRWYLRANKIVALLVQLARAVAQLQRQARARGELR